MSYILTPRFQSLKTPITIANGGTQADNGKDGLANLVVDGGGVVTTVNSICSPDWGTPLIPDADPSIAVIQIVDFLTILGVCNQ